MILPSIDADVIETLFGDHEHLFTYLDEGCSRTAYTCSLLPGVVVKRAQARYDISDNMNEAYRYADAADDVRPLLAACYGVSTSGYTLLMEQVQAYKRRSPKQYEWEETFTPDDNGRLSDPKDREVRKFLCMIERDYGIGDMHSRNVGLAPDGTLKVLDYACSW